MENPITSIEAWLFFQWAKDAPIGSEAKIMGTHIRRVPEGVMVLEALLDVNIVGTLTITEC